MTLHPHLTLTLARRCYSRHFGTCTGGELKAGTVLTLIGEVEPGWWKCSDKHGKWVVVAAEFLTQQQPPPDPPPYPSVPAGLWDEIGGEG